MSPHSSHPHRLRGLRYLLLHLLLGGLSLYLAFFLRFDLGRIPPVYTRQFLYSLPLAMVLKAAAAELFGINRGLWRYASMRDFIRILQACLAAQLVFIPLVLLTIGHGYPRGIYLLDLVLSTGLLTGVRLAGRHWIRGEVRPFLKDKLSGEAVLILGAGDAGELVLRQFNQPNTPHAHVVGFLDDDPGKQGMSIHGVPILGPLSELADWLADRQITTVVIGIRNPPPDLLRTITEVTARQGVRVHILPTLRDLMTGQVEVKPLRELRLEDLLGREPVKLDPTPVKAALQGKRVLLTGAGGSIGTELARQIATFDPACLILLDFSENALFEIERELAETCPALSLAHCLCDVRDIEDLDRVFVTHTPNVVFHAAACKHVPMMESHPRNAFRTNVQGTAHVVQTARKHSVERLLLVSTDKAAAPASVMGASKWLCEQIVRDTALREDRSFSCVRFGNVIGSSGSVVPIFEKQIARGGPVRVTHPDATRYFMTIPEAVSLILQADALSRPGDVFILDMGEPVRILDLARNLIRLSGHQPDVDMPIEITGLRPGDKIHETLAAPHEQLSKTDIHKLNRLAPSPPRLTGTALQETLQQLTACVGDEPQLKQALLDLCKT